MHGPAVRRYLKRIFRDLFERQSFEDDGVFDWDIIKKQQLVSVDGNPAIEAMINESNSASAVRTGAESAQNNPAGDPNAPLRQPTTTSNNGIGTAAKGQEDDSLNGADKNSEFKDAPGAPRRSIISSIRYVTKHVTSNTSTYLSNHRSVSYTSHSLFGSRTGSAAVANPGTNNGGSAVDSGSIKR